MQHLFFATLHLRIKILGCPESGIPALDWRRAAGLPERLDNEYPVSIEGQVSETDFRRLVSEGYKAFAMDDGSRRLSFVDLDTEFDPLRRSSYGHYATIEVSVADTPVDLACKALAACRREQLERHLDAPALRRERAELLARVSELNEQLKPLEST